MDQLPSAIFHPAQALDRRCLQSPVVFHFVTMPQTLNSFTVVQTTTSSPCKLKTRLGLSGLAATSNSTQCPSPATIAHTAANNAPYTVGLVAKMALETSWSLADFRSGSKVEALLPHLLRTKHADVILFVQECRTSRTLKISSMVDLAPALAPDRIASANPIEIRCALMAWRRCP